MARANWYRARGALTDSVLKGRDHALLIYVCPEPKATQQMFVEWLLVWATFAEELITTILPMTGPDPSTKDLTAGCCHPKSSV